MNETLPEIDADVLDVLPEEFGQIHNLTATGRSKSGKHAQTRVLVKAVCILLASGWPVCRIAENFNCSDRIVELIRDRFASEVSEHQRELGRDCFRLSWKLKHHVETSLESMAPKDAAIAFGILVDKGLLLTGQPTAIVEQRSVVHEPEHLVEWLKQQAIDVTPSAQISEGESNSSHNRHYDSVKAPI